MKGSAFCLDEDRGLSGGIGTDDDADAAEKRHQVLHLQLVDEDHGDPDDSDRDRR